MEESDANSVRLELTLILLSLLWGRTDSVYLETPYNRHKHWSRLDVPNPRKDVWKCGRDGITSAICDPERLLSKSEANAIDTAMETFRATTGTGVCNCQNPDDCRRTPGLLTSKKSLHLDNIYGGWQPGVLIVSQIKLNSESNGDSESEQLSSYVRYLRERSWNFGVCEDDFVILISINQGLVYTDIGHNLQKTLPPSCAHRIFEDYKFYFHDDDYVSGITAILDTYADVMTGRKQCKRRVPISVYVSSVGVTLMLLIGVFLVRRRIKYSACYATCEKQRESCADRCYKRHAKRDGISMYEYSYSEGEGDEAESFYSEYTGGSISSYHLSEDSSFLAQES